MDIDAGLFVVGGHQTIAVKMGNNGARNEQKIANVRPQDNTPLVQTTHYRRLLTWQTNNCCSLR